MTNATITQPRYGTAARGLHWLVALLVAAQITLGLGHGIEGGLGDAFMSWHLRVGLLILALMLVRTGVRLTYGAPALPATVSDWQRRAAGVNHALLYLLLLALPVLGWLTASAEGETIHLLGGIAAPPLIERNETVADWAGELHELGAFALMALAGLHIAAALNHHFLRRDGVLRRML